MVREGWAVRLIVALVFAAPAAVAGYTLVYGVKGEAVPSEVWRGYCRGVAMIRLAASFR